MPTIQQEKNRRTALENIEAGRNQDVGIPGTITVDDLLKNDTAVDVRGDDTLTKQRLADIPPLIEPAKEKELSEAEKRLEAVGGVAGEREAFLKEERGKEEFQALKTTQSDLASQLERIRAEQEQFELNKITIPEELQRKAVGRGITKGGLQPFTAGELRKNLLAQAKITSKGLYVKGDLLAVQGLIADARETMDDAADAKFAARERQLEIEQDNLDRISRRPDLTAKERQLIEDRNNIIAEQNQQIADDKRAELDKGDAIVDIIKDNPNIDAETIRLMREAEDTIGVFRIASERGILKPDEVIPGITDPGEPLSINQIEQFRRAYGWTPPLGFTSSQLTQYIADNPDATPEELEAGANSITDGEVKGVEVEKVTVSETVTSIMDSVTDDQLKTLKKKADDAGISKIFRFKKGDVKAYLNSISGIIQEAIDEGATTEEILSALIGE